MVVSMLFIRLLQGLGWRTRGWRCRHDAGSQRLAGGLRDAPDGARRTEWR